MEINIHVYHAMNALWISQEYTNALHRRYTRAAGFPSASGEAPAILTTQVGQNMPFDLYSTMWLSQQSYFSDKVEFIENRTESYTEVTPSAQSHSTATPCSSIAVEVIPAAEEEDKQQGAPMTEGWQDN